MKVILTLGEVVPITTVSSGRIVNERRHLTSQRGGSRLEKDQMNASTSRLAWFLSTRLGLTDFVVREVMIGGFALVAAPAEYGVTGVKTFIVSSSTSF
jgi:hypothetical protein